MLKNKQAESCQTIVVGGGAAGLVAAIVAARRKQDVLIIEKKKALGRKILVTGNGRCNLTNINLSPDKYYGENTKCLHNIFSRFSHNDTMRFFEKLGVKLKTEPDGRVFPVTDKASIVLDALVKETARLKIKINLEERVKKLSSIKTGWEVKTNKDVYQAKTVILVTGGKSYPQLGSTGDGFNLARNFGHRIIEPRPALVPLELEGNWFRELQGIQVNVDLSLKAQGKTISNQTGELIFTHFGISGPAVLDISRVIIDCLNKSTCNVSINFLPNYKNSKEVSDFLIGLWKEQPKRILVNSLAGLLPKKLCFVLLNQLKVKPDKQVSQITKNETVLITEKLRNWNLIIKRPRPFSESMVTAGGVSMDEVNPKTMESSKAKGLYFAGEILDIDGVSGGYNLQFAWSTGYIAGNSV